MQKSYKIFIPRLHNVLSIGTSIVKIWLPSCLIGCVRFARYCGKMYSRHLFSYGGYALAFIRLPTLILRCCDIQYADYVLYTWSNLFVSLNCSFIICWFLHSLFRSFVRSFVSFIRLFICLLSYFVSFVRLCVFSFFRSFVHSSIRFVRSFVVWSFFRFFCSSPLLNSISFHRAI